MDFYFINFPPTIFTFSPPSNENEKSYLLSEYMESN